jgi:hypothetical protein
MLPESWIIEVTITRIQLNIERKKIDDNLLKEDREFLN